MLAFDSERLQEVDLPISGANDLLLFCHVVVLALLLIVEGEIPLQLGAVLDGTGELDLGDVLDVILGECEDPVHDRLLAGDGEAVLVSIAVPIVKPFILSVVTSVAPWVVPQGIEW